MKWYAVIAFSVLHTVCGVLSVKAFAFLETGDAGNMSLFGGVFFMPVLYFISAKVTVKIMQIVKISKTALILRFETFALMK